MSRQGSRNLTLTEELEKLEQSITLTLQEIDSNFSKAHRIVTGSILPVVEQYAKHSGNVWEGSKVRISRHEITCIVLTGKQFWKQFFEASANVSLSGYEEAAMEEDVTHTETTTHDDDDDEDTVAREEEADDDDSFSVDSPTQVTGAQSTPKLPPSTAKGRNAAASFRSPSPRKYTGKNPLAVTPSSEEPSTPRPQTTLNFQSSPFEPNSAAFRPSARQNNDPLLHRGVLDKNYRIQATPHTQRRKQQQQQYHASTKPTPATASKTTRLWDDSPDSSPAVAAPQLRSDLFSPVKGGAKGPIGGGPRTPGISLLTPARPKTGQPGSAGIPSQQPSRDLGYTLNNDFDDEEDDDSLEMSPPKTLQFHVPQSRLLQTPAREASRRIVEDLLLTAGADATDEIEGDEFGEEEASPSVVRGAFHGDEDTF